MKENKDQRKEKSMKTKHVIKSRDFKWLHQTNEDWSVQMPQQLKG
jgi:hypothetical protein